MVPIKNLKVVHARDYGDVVATLTSYVTSCARADWELAGEAFRDDAIMYGYQPTGLVGGSYRALKDVFDACGPFRDQQCWIDVLDLTPTTAVARVQMDYAGDGGSFTDFHLLVKEDDVWRVLAKVYHRYDG